MKHMYRYFIAVLKYGYEIGVYELNHECASDNTREQMFYFDSNTTLPLRCAALVFWGDTVC